jgi:hypothetical protein
MNDNEPLAKKFYEALVAEAVRSSASSEQDGVSPLAKKFYEALVAQPRRRRKLVRT